MRVNPLARQMSMDGYRATCFTSAASRFRMFFVRDAEAESPENRLLTAIKNYALNFNIFDKRVPFHVTSYELRNGIYSTRIFLFSLIVSLTALVLFGTLLNETQTVTISNVTEEEYQKLEQKYSQTLRCPCQKISIEYKEFSSIQPILHPICSSVYVTDQWYSGYLSFPANSLPYPFLNTLRGPQSFRSIGPAQFRLLSLFCNVSNRTVQDNLVLFKTTTLITAHAISSSLFQSQTTAFINEFISSTISSFNQLLDTIVSTTQNDVFSMNFGPLNLWVQDDTDFNSFLGILSECSKCEAHITCLNPALLYPPTDVLPPPSFPLELQFRYFISGWYGGCSIMGSLLLSNLECFFSAICYHGIALYIYAFDERAHYSSSGGIYPAPYFRTYTNLNSSELIRSKSNSSIKEIFQQLMVESWNPRIFYSKYFLACQPTSCTYTRIAKRGLLSTVSLIVGLVGGLTTILKLVIPPIVAFLRRNKRPPPSSQSNTDRRRRQRRKKCIGYRPLWQHRARSRR